GSPPDCSGRSLPRLVRGLRRLDRCAFGERSDSARMELLRMRSILWRWRWVIISVVAVSAAAVASHVLTSPTVYHARVRLQITDRLDGDVFLLDTGSRPSSTL